MQDVLRASSKRVGHCVSRGWTVQYRARRGCAHRRPGLLLELAHKRQRLSYHQLAAMLGSLGERGNLNRVYHLYRYEQPPPRRKLYCRHIAEPRGELQSCSRPNQRWSLDLMRDRPRNDRKFWMLNVTYDCTLETIHGPSDS